MKVIRKRKGYRIELSDAEYNVLCDVVAEGVEGLVHDTSHLPPAEQKAFEEVFSRHDCLDVDENRRG